MIATATRTSFPSVNLLPPETRERQRARRVTGIVVAAGAGVLAILALLFVMQTSHLASLRKQVAAQDSANAALQAKATRLQQYETLQQSVQARQQLVDAALAGDIDWSNILHELSAAIPSQAWFTNIAGMSASASGTGDTTTAPAPTTGTTDTGIVGSLTFQGDALDTNTLSSFLVRLQREPGWVNAWMSTAAKSAVGSTPVWAFTSSVDLMSDALSRRGGGPK
jgi:Tfp pilus assembly protein PilN